MKIVSLTVLHYGREWLEWALRSVADVMDEMYIFYTPHPSHHGEDTKFTCPDSQEELYAIASAFPTVKWETVTQFWHEGAHRDYARHVCERNGADMILVLDADEVWDIEDLDGALQQAWDGKEDIFRSRIKGNFWRSVNWVCYDQLMPERIIVPGRGREFGHLSGAGFWHFGYAISHEMMIYKLRIHGHKDDLRPRWYPEKYRDWDSTVRDVHPTNGGGFWNPVPIDRNDVAHLIGDHNYFKDELI
jgi:hypothetical protein